MDASQVQSLTNNVRPISGAFQAFEDVPLTPLHDQDPSSNVSGGFSHVPMEHEIVASESVWDYSGTFDELIEQQIVISKRLSGKSSHAASTCTTREHSLGRVPDVVVGQVRVASEVSRDPALEAEEAVPTSAVLKPGSDLADLSETGFASTVTLVETSSVLNTTLGPTDVVKKISFSTDSPLYQSPGLPESASDIGVELGKSSEHVEESTGPAEFTTSTPPAIVIARATFPRVERPEPATPISIPDLFEIPVPVFPFPAGTSRCKNRDCPIKSRHEQGPYLHEGKLRTREGSIFGSSNPPPEIWFLYDRSGNGGFQGDGDKAFAPVELFVKYHFGETRSECVLASKELGGDVEQKAEQGGKKLKSWWFWS